MELTIAHPGIVLILTPHDVDDPARLAKRNYRDVVIGWLEFVTNHDMATL